MTNRLITKYKIAIVKIAQEVAKYLSKQPKKLQSIWATIVRKVFDKIIQKQPNMATLLVTN